MREQLPQLLRASCGVRVRPLRALRRQHPELSEDELRVLFVELNHGEPLARRLRADLERRGRLG